MMQKLMMISAGLLLVLLSAVHCQSGEPELSCGVELMEITLTGATKAHIGEEGCANTETRDGKLVISVERLEAKCGNTLKVDGSTVEYGNVVSVDGVDIPFSCSYTIEDLTNLDVNIHPFLIGASLAGFAQHPIAHIALFKSDDFRQAFPSGSISLPAGSPLHIGVKVDDIDERVFATVVDDCFANHSADPEDGEKIELIENRCPADKSVVTGLEGGNGLESHFTANLKEQGEVYIHCNAILCDKRHGSCVPNCNARRRRSAQSTVALKPATFGPITLA